MNWVLKDTWKEVRLKKEWVFQARKKKKKEVLEKQWQNVAHSEKHMKHMWQYICELLVDEGGER